MKRIFEQISQSNSDINNIDKFDCVDLSDDDKYDDCSAEPPTQKQKPNSNKVLFIYTDGACTDNGSPNAVAGIGVYYNHKNYTPLSEPVPVSTSTPPIPDTNNIAETLAVIRALEDVERQRKEKGDVFDKYVIYTDSIYVQKGYTEWWPNWTKKKLWGSKKNVALIQRLIALIDTISTPIEMIWVKGHAGTEGNEMADQLATKGVEEKKQLLARSMKEMKEKKEKYD